MTIATSSTVRATQLAAGARLGWQEIRDEADRNMRLASAIALHQTMRHLNVDEITIKANYWGESDNPEIIQIVDDKNSSTNSIELRDPVASVVSDPAYWPYDPDSDMWVRHFLPTDFPDDVLSWESTRDFHTHTLVLRVKDIAVDDILADLTTPLL